MMSLLSLPHWVCRDGAFFWYFNSGVIIGTLERKEHCACLIPLHLWGPEKARHFDLPHFGESEKTAVPMTPRR